MKKLTAEDILKLALEKKAITIPKASVSCMPAAFLQCMQFHVVMRFVNLGVYEYKKKNKSKTPWKKSILLICDV
jgi:hypothetical protein